MAAPDTTALLASAREGSDEALNDLYARVAGKLLTIVRMRLGASLRGRLESRDILHTVLLRSVERIGQFRGQDGTTLMAWLSRMAENEIRDQADFHGRQRRKAGAEVPIEENGKVLPVPAALPSVVTQIVADEERERLARALALLPSDHREVIVLRKLEERSWSEVAARMNRSEDACRMLLARAMVGLTLQLREAV
jgi:RNA polymerase sigma-70 factor (ECF subfamily)